jgi:transposase-like protein
MATIRIHGQSRETLGPKVKHRRSAYANRRIKRNNRGIKQRNYPTLGFGH